MNQSSFSDPNTADHTDIATIVIDPNWRDISSAIWLETHDDAPKIEFISSKDYPF